MVFKDEQLLIEAYKAIFEKNEACGCPKDCDRKKCEEEKIEEAIKAKKGKPDYLDVDEDGDKNEPFKKALKDKSLKEGSLTFKELYKTIINN